MNANDFLFVDYEGRLFVCSKARWNAANGHVPDDHDATQEALTFLKTVSPDFTVEGECLFRYQGKKSIKAAKQLLTQAGVAKGQFGVQA